MEKPTYRELEEKVVHLEQKVSHIIHLEDQLKLLEQKFLQVEKQLRKRQQMDALGTLAQGVAHDFNNVLSGIMAYLNILSLTADNFSPSQKTYVQNMINAVKRGAATVKQFQQLSSRTVSERENIDIHAVAQEVFLLLEKTTDKIIDKNLDIEKGRFFVCADTNELHQVFMNLGINAVHAIEEKGVGKPAYIRLSVNPVPVKLPRFKHLSQGEFYEFRFEDTGIGMSEAVMKKAFDPLFTTKQEDKGQGMGLAMVYDIITKRNSGHIEIESETGKGTVFHIFLPKADDECGMVPEQLTIQGGTETILVVDDDTSVRASIKTALEDFGYRVILASDGLEGLALFKENQDRISAVLLDIIMPKMSGKELLRELLKIDPAVKVIISSGHSEDQYTDIVIKSAKNYLKKPFEIDLLESTLRQVLDL